MSNRFDQIFVIHYLFNVSYHLSHVFILIKETAPIKPLCVTSAGKTSCLLSLWNYNNHTSISVLRICLLLSLFCRSFAKGICRMETKVGLTVLLGHQHCIKCKCLVGWALLGFNNVLALQRDVNHYF